MATDLMALLERTLPPLGYELVELEMSPRGRTLRVFIDKPEGIDVDDCGIVSNHLSRLLMVENIDYDRLEVSSPGLDRPLRKEADFVRFAGEEAELRLVTPRANNRRKYVGKLAGVEAGAVLFDCDEGRIVVPLTEIDRARLVPKIDWSKAR